MDYSKEGYKNLKSHAREDGVKFYTEDLTDCVSDYNGVSVAFAPATRGDDNRMVFVSVSYCAPEDKFKPKHGKFQALAKFYNDETIQLPLGQYLRDVGAKQFGAYLLELFTV